MNNKKNMIGSDEGLSCSFFKIIEYGVSWLRKLSEIPTGH